MSAQIIPFPTRTIVLPEPAEPVQVETVRVEMIPVDMHAKVDIPGASMADAVELLRTATQQICTNLDTIRAGCEALCDVNRGIAEQARGLASGAAKITLSMQELSSAAV
jgi:hypothetical protein